MALPVRVSRGQGFEPFELMQRQFDDALSRFLGGREQQGGMMAPYGVDIREDADHLYVEAEMPGFKKEDVDISLENQTLTISASKSEEQREPQKEGKKSDYLLHERRVAEFVRSFTLPNSIDEQQVNAKLSDGVLTITLNKKQEAKPKRIQVS